MRKRIISLILCCLIVLSLSACSSSGNKKSENKDAQAKGRYIEEEVQLPKLAELESVNQVMTDKDGNLVIYTVAEADVSITVYKYTKTDSGYEKEEVSWMTNALSECAMFGNVVEGEDGYTYVTGANFSQLEGNQEKYYQETRLFRHQGDDDSYEEVTPDFWNSKDDTDQAILGTTINGLQVTKNSEIIYTDEMTLENVWYSLSQKQIKDLPEIDTQNAILLKNNILYWIDSKTLNIMSVDLNTTQTQVITTLSSISDSTHLSVNETQDLYVIDTNGVNRFLHNGSMLETIIDGSLNTMATPSQQVLNLVVLSGEKEQYFVLYQSYLTFEFRFCKYQYDETVPALPSKELTVYSLYENTTLREAISNYQRTHSDVKISYYAAAQGDSDIDVIDLIHALNTEVLAGNGADVFLMDGLPIDSYIEKGVLTDLSEFLNPMIEDQTLFSNIMDNYVKDGKIYCAPIRYSVPLFVGYSDQLSDYTTLDSITQKAQTMENGTILPQSSYEQLLKKFIYTYLDQLVDEDGTLNKDVYLKFLTQMKTLSDQAGCAADALNDIVISDNGLDGNVSIVKSMLSDDPVHLILTNAQAAMTAVSSMTDYDMLNAVMNSIDGTMKSINNTYVPNGIVAINQAAKDKELAIDFVKSLFDEEIQSVQVRDGFPVNQKSFDQWFVERMSSEVQSGLYMMLLDDQGNAHTIEGATPTQEEVDAFRTLISEVDTPVNNDTQLIKLIISESIGYLTGEKTAEEATNDVITKYTLYQAEGAE